MIRDVGGDVGGDVDGDEHTATVCRRPLKYEGESVAGTEVLVIEGEDGEIGDAGFADVSCSRVE